MFSLAPSDESSPVKPCSVPYWDFLQTSVQGKVEFPLPLRYMQFSSLPGPEGAGAAWSLPAPVRADFPRQSVSVPGEPESRGGPSSRWVKHGVCVLSAVTFSVKARHRTLTGTGHKARSLLWAVTALTMADEATAETLSVAPLVCYQHSGSLFPPSFFSVGLWPHSKKAVSSFKNTVIPFFLRYNLVLWCSVGQPGSCQPNTNTDTRAE